MNKLRLIKTELNKLVDERQARILQRFFKTGPGEYGEGDEFLGIKVPVQRRVALQYLDMSLVEVEKLLHSKIHEYRMTALIILVEKFKRARKLGIRDKELGSRIYELYLRNTKWINNWDLVDLSAQYIVGEFLLTLGVVLKKNKNNNDVTSPLPPSRRGILDDLAKSESLWERRIAIVSTHAFIRVGEFADTIGLAEILLKDEHDLMHKAVGWMLREVGKKSDEGLRLLYKFLDRNGLKMPRTMLRYAIERLPEEKRQDYLKRKA